MSEKVLMYYSTIIIWLPIMMTIIFYWINLKLYSNRWRAIHFATQWSALIYLMATWQLVYQLYAVNIVSYTLIVIIVFLAIALIIDWKTKTEVILINGIRLLLRVVFLIFTLSYLILLIIYFLKFFELLNS